MQGRNGVWFRLRRCGSRARGFLSHLYYQQVLAPRGAGQPVAAEVWDHQYHSGHWAVLDAPIERGRYDTIVRYLHQFTTQPTILDLGCGSGRLLDLLATTSYDAYQGVDLSLEALLQAKARGSRKATFTHADFERWQPSSSYDVIIFNESLYYAKKPVDCLLRYVPALRPGGIIIVSLYRAQNHPIIENHLLRHVPVLASSHVGNGLGHVWDIHVLQPPASS
jgi:SAM-dependent methyltransferase